MARDSWVGYVAQINVSTGGVPKYAVPAAEVKSHGLQTDRQRNRRHHGGPERAVCLYGLECLQALRSEGHPIDAGAIGENLTLAGLPWARVTPNATLEFQGGVRLQVASFAAPCGTIAAAFLVGDITRVSQESHAGWSRVYARVLREGRLQRGERITLTEPRGGRS